MVLGKVRPGYIASISAITPMGGSSGLEENGKLGQSGQGPHTASTNPFPTVEGQICSVRRARTSCFATYAEVKRSETESRDALPGIANRQ